MALFFTTTLGISIVGMVSLLALKRYELKSGKMFLQTIRPHLNRVFHRSLMFVERILPALVRHSIERLVVFLMRAAQRLIARTIVLAEYWLERVLDFLRMTTHIPHPSAPASAFLREVAEHKKSLIKRLPAQAGSRRERLIVHK